MAEYKHECVEYLSASRGIDGSNEYSTPAVAEAGDAAKLVLGAHAIGVDAIIHYMSPPPNGRY
jgi:hypothetical protein